MTALPRSADEAIRVIRPALLAAALVAARTGPCPGGRRGRPVAPVGGSVRAAVDRPEPGGPPPQESCVTCHAAIDNAQHDITEQWKTSVHGQNGIGCSSCHGGDPTSDEVTVAMSTAAGFIGKPDRTATVSVCGDCHSDVERMRQYQLPTDQLAKYQTSVHGQRLAHGQGHAGRHLHRLPRGPRRQEGVRSDRAGLSR